VTPIDLFPGDLKRLQPHLQMEGACFKIDYNGPKRAFKIVTQIWERGKGKDGGVAAATFEGPSTGEASISIKKTTDDKREPAWHIISNWSTPLGGATFSIPKTLPKDDIPGQQVHGVKNVAEFDAEEDVGLWCIVRAAGEIPFTQPIDELAKSVDFAVVLKIVPVK